MLKKLISYVLFALLSLLLFNKSGSVFSQWISCVSFVYKIFSCLRECFLIGFSLFGPMGSFVLFDWHIVMSAPPLLSNLITYLVVTSFQSSNYFLNIGLEVFPPFPLAFSQGCKVIFPKGILNV